MPPASHRPPDRAVHLRDAGLRKVSIATRLLVVGAVAAAGAFAAMAAWAQPGRSKTAATVRGRSVPVAPQGSGTTATVPATTPATVAPASGNDDLTPPTTVPVTAPAPDPGVQYVPPSYQYSPPVVSHAT
jgi:hypothetical protein